MREERGWIRNAKIIQARRSESIGSGGFIECRTDKTSHYWIYLPKRYYQAIRNTLQPTVHVPPPMVQRICDYLNGRTCDVRIRRIFVDSNQSFIDAEIHLHTTPAYGDYILGEGGHG